jgi:hypothetical protein
MNTIYRGLFALTTLLLTADLFASHAAGADMTYKYLGSNQYLITAKLYRDCRGTSMGTPTFGAYAGNNGGNGCFTTSLTFTHISIKDITSTCSTGSKPCNPANTYGTGNGIEEHVYTCTVDLAKAPFKDSIAKSSCCEVAFYCSIGTRASSITTGSANQGCAVKLVINFCNLYKCAVPNSNGVAFHVPANAHVCCNTSAVIALGGKDADGDQVRYKFTPALTGVPANPVNYSSPYSYRYPVLPYCIPFGKVDCTPNLTTNPVRGTFLDSITGDMQYTPTKCDEVSVIALEAREYREDTSGKLVWIAYSCRDFLHQVRDDCDYNKYPRFANYQSAYGVLEGDTLRMDFDLLDEAFTPFQTIPDTPVITSWDSMPGSKLLLLNPGDREKKYRIEWPTDSGTANGSDILIRVKGSDKHCPQPGYTSISLKIRIQKKGDSIWMLHSPNGCGGQYLQAFTKPDDPFSTYSWTLVDTATKAILAQSNARDWSTPNYLRGHHKIILQVVNGYHNFNQLEKIIHFTGDTPTVNIGADTAICKGENIEISAVVSHVKPPIKYFWKILEGPKLISSPITTTISFTDLKISKSIRLTISDSFGCVLVAPEKKIIVKTMPDFNLGDDKTICYSTPVSIGIANNTSRTYLWNNGETTSKINATSTGSYSLQVTSDSGCVYSDTIAINAIDSPDLNISDNSSCPNKNPIDLNDILLWNGAAMPLGKAIYTSANSANPVLNNHFLKIDSTITPGNWTINYVFPVAGCPDFKSDFSILLYHAPKANFSMTPVAWAADSFDIFFQNNSSIGDGSPLLYLWDFGRTTNDTASAKDNTIRYAKSKASYFPSLIVRSENGCESRLQRILNTSVGLPVGEKKYLVITNDLVVLDGEFSAIKIQLFDGSGRLLQTWNDNLGMMANGSANLPSGIYFFDMEIQDKTNTTHHRGKVILPVLR